MTIELLDTEETQTEDPMEVQVIKLQGLWSHLCDTDKGGCQECSLLFHSKLWDRLSQDNECTWGRVCGGLCVLDIEAADTEVDLNADWLRVVGLGTGSFKSSLEIHC